MPVDAGVRDAEVRRLAERLIEQIGGGAAFGAVARQFSQSATAAVNGDMGWVGRSDLQPELRDPVARLEPGDLSAPLRTPAGYTVVRLRETRTAGGGPVIELRDLQQVFLPVADGAPPAVRTAQARLLTDLLEASRSCADLGGMAGRLDDPYSGFLKDMRAADFTDAVGPAIAALRETGAATRPLPVEGGLVGFMLCDRRRRQQDIAPPPAEAIRQDLIARRVETMARRRLRDLRRAAFIDVRI